MEEKPKFSTCGRKRQNILHIVQVAEVWKGPIKSAIDFVKMYNFL